MDWGEEATNYYHVTRGLPEKRIDITAADNLLALTIAGPDYEESCPACVLATIRQFKEGSYSFDWDFKKQMKWWLGEFGEDRTSAYVGVY